MTWAVARKDLVSELRTRDLLPALAQFAVLAIVIANFAFDVDQASVRRIAPGILWLVLVFAGLVAFGRTFAAEREHASLEAVLMTPAGAEAVFAGKALAAGLMLLACQLVVLPMMALYFGVPLLSPRLAGAVLLATFGMATIGCLFSAMAAQLRARELLLPVLALPLWIPFVVYGGRAVQLAMGAPGEGSNQALAGLAVLDILFAVVTTVAIRYVLDD